MDGYGYGYGFEDSAWAKQPALGSQQRYFYPDTTSTSLSNVTAGTTMVMTGVGGPADDTARNRPLIGNHPPTNFGESAGSVSYLDTPQYSIIEGYRPSLSNYPPYFQQRPNVPPAYSFRGRRGRGYGGAAVPGAGGGVGGFGGNFPRKTRGFRMEPSQMPPAKKQKRYSSAGKTAAMILNELFTDCKDNFSFVEVAVNKIPRFQCSYSIRDKTFTTEGPNKKIAKQMACEKALKFLRPDIVLDEAVTSIYEKKLENYACVASENEKNKETEANDPPPAANDPSAVSNSLIQYFLDLYRRKIGSTNDKRDPQFSIVTLSSETTPKTFQCKLVLPNHDKVFVREGSGKASLKNAVVREALVEVLGVDPVELKKVELKILNLRSGKPFQVLQQALNYFDRRMRLKVDPVEGNSRFVCTITLDDDNNRKYTGVIEDSKQKAKDSACIKVLSEEFEINIENPDQAPRQACNIFSPPFVLYQLFLKKNPRSRPDISYSEAEDITSQPGKPTLFKVKLTVNGTEEFEGVGHSKKLARGAAAQQAITKIFNFDINAENAVELLTVKSRKPDDSFKLCQAICAFVKKEYKSICDAQSFPMTEHLSAFVIVSPKGEKKLVSFGTGENAIIDEEVFKSDLGSVLIHLQSTVLARRAFLVYISKQIDMIDDPDSVVEKSTISNKYRLKKGYKVVLYLTYPPNFCTNGMAQKLSFYEDGILKETTDAVESEAQKLRVMSVSDKILKWNYLGIQGALLSHVIEPVFITHLFFGSLSDCKSVENAVLLRFGIARKDSLVVRSFKESIAHGTDHYCNWIAGLNSIEHLIPSTGRAIDGLPSRLSKLKLYENWVRMLNTMENSDHKTCTYNAAKQSETVYQCALEGFIAQLTKLDLGVWMRKADFVDQFQLPTPDSEC